MAKGRDLLGEMGPERSIGRRPTGLSRPTPRDVRNYKPPQGPSNITEPKAPGLHGESNYCGLQEEDRNWANSSGGPGIGGDSDCCTQGKH